MPNRGVGIEDGRETARYGAAEIYPFVQSAYEEASPMSLQFFRLFVPIEPIRRSFRRELSLQEWQDVCSAAGLSVLDTLDLTQKKLDWWDDQRLLVGRVTRITKHPNANNLIIVDIDYGIGRTAQILTSTMSLVHFLGASPRDLIRLAINVAYAAVGAEVVSPESEKQPRRHMKMKIKTFRGLPSEGMVCSEREVGLGEYQDDIFLLPPDIEPGTPLRTCLGDAVLCLAITPEGRSWQPLPCIDDVIQSISQTMEHRKLVGSSRSL
jgi:phenylalanyl-tRNA synthetase beta chain